MEAASLDISTQDASNFYSRITVKKIPETMEWVSARDGCLIRRLRFLIPITQFGTNILHPIIHFISEHRERRGLWVGMVSALGFPHDIMWWMVQFLLSGSTRTLPSDFPTGHFPYFQGNLSIFLNDPTQNRYWVVPSVPQGPSESA